MFIAAYGDWGTVWEVNTVQVTGNPMFDYFFTLVLLFGMISMMCGWLFKLMTRSAALPFLAITNYDCGDMSNAVITSDSFSGVIDITTNGVASDFYIRRNSPISFHCSGDMSIDVPSNSIHVLLSSISLQGVWSENFLMGLAGLACGFLMSYVLVKYAV